MTLRIQKKFIAAIAAASIAITSFSAAPARAGEDDMARAIATILGLAVIGAVIADKKKDKKVVRHPRPQPEPRPRPRRVERKLLPPQCLRSFETVSGRHARIFGQRCLNRNYAFTNSLPQDCQRRVRTYDGNRRGYGARCLRRYGYQLARR